MRVFIVDLDGFWMTKCGETWEFTAGGVKENRISYCPYCGRRIKEKDGKA